MKFRLDRVFRRGQPARLDAAFRCLWSDPVGCLVAGVRVGEWAMPGNAQAGAGRLAPAIPRLDFFAIAREGIDQVACGYAPRGSEFDCVGVIFGPDLVCRPVHWGWVGQLKETDDRVVSRVVTTCEFTT